MPGGDRTGPEGRGERTGRRAGYCDGYDEPGYVDPGPRRGLGRGLGRGFGRGGSRGSGRGEVGGSDAGTEVKSPGDYHP